MKFFVQNIPFYILEEKSKFSFEQRAYVIGNVSVSKIIYIYEQLKKGLIKGVSSVVVFVKNYNRVVIDLQNFFEFRKAAGGLVVKKDTFLCIYRSGIWDLPKGHIEKNEDSKTAALREVLEETGVKVQITSFLTETLHTYESRSGKNILKKTYWFNMQCEEDKHLKAQKEENIEKVLWLTKQEIVKVIFENTYTSIKDVFTSAGFSCIFKGNKFKN